MGKDALRERPFEKLRRRAGGEAFDEATVRNWYIARAYVLDKLKDTAFTPGQNAHLHVVVDGDSPLMLALVRQTALCAHYLNFVEYDQFDRLACSNRSVITIVSGKAGIADELRKEEFLCNLMQCCKYSIYGKTANEDSYLDVEVEVVKDAAHEGAIVYTEEDVKAFLAGKPEEEIFTVDTRKAKLAHRIYGLGGVIDNIPYEDIFGVGRYSQALDVFRDVILKDDEDVSIEISDIICTDCFESRERAVSMLCPGYSKLGTRAKRAVWEKNNQALSLSEHSRWVVEKLIMGFRPYTNRERICYANLFGAERKALCAQLKKNASSPAHIDLCSYKELRRTDPDNLKYDSFLMLAVPLILEQIRKKS